MKQDKIADSPKLRNSIIIVIGFISSSHLHQIIIDGLLIIYFLIAAISWKQPRMWPKPEYDGEDFDCNTALYWAETWFPIAGA